MTRQTRHKLRERSGHGAAGNMQAKLKGLARRMRIAASTGATWLVKGLEDEFGNVESDSVENFEGIGFASRPLSTDNAEVIAIKVGGKSSHPVIVAARSRDVFKVLEDAEGLEEGEVAVFSRQSMIKIKADGTIELGSIGGTRQKLATIADLNALKAWIDLHTHEILSGSSAGTSGTPFTGASPTPTGTTKVEAE